MFEAKTGAYRFQLDEDWFRLDANLLREALEITPVNQAHQFVLPSLGDAMMDFVNQLGYLGEIYFVSRMAVNNLYQPWRAILSMINKYLTGKTSGFDRNDLTTSPIWKCLKSINEELQLRKKVLVDKPDEEQDQPKVVPEPQEATNPLLVVEGKGKAIATKEQVAQSLLALHTSKRRICETPSPIDAKAGTDTDKEKTVVLDKGQAGSDPGKTLVSRPPPDDDKMDEDQARSDTGKSHVALAGPNPKPMHDNFVATVYPKVHESLKFLADEQVILEDPPSSSRTLPSTKNMDETYTFGDQFFNNKSTKDEPKKHNVDAKVISMVIVPIHHAFTSVPPLSTPIIDMSPPKLAASPLLESFTAATTKTTTTTLPLLPSPQKQSTTDSEVAARVTALEKKFVDLSRKARLLITRLISVKLYMFKTLKY
nr:hypothetical protein [Tanacetum cinerariifolium]